MISNVGYTTIIGGKGIRVAVGNPGEVSTIVGVGIAGGTSVSINVGVLVGAVVIVGAGVEVLVIVDVGVGVSSESSGVVVGVRVSLGTSV